MTVDNKTNIGGIVFFASRPDRNASNRYRIYKMAEQMKQDGIECIVCPPYSNRLYSKLLNRPGKCILLVITIITFFNRIFQLRHLRKYRIAIVQQEMMRFFPPIFERLLKRWKIKLIFDFDDANFALHQLANSKSPSRYYDYSKTAKIIKLSDYVLAGSEYLKNYAMQITDKVAKVPTSVDFERYTLKNVDGHKPVIGWIGTSSSLKYLEPMEAVFSQLRQEGADFSVKIVCNLPFEFSSVETIYKKWKLEDEIEDLKSFDIGIMPISDDQYARAKCGFKIIQYMAVGIPVVCSPVGENVLIAGKQNSCLLADTMPQWVEKLSLLLADGKLRKTMGQYGRKTVGNNYTIHKNVERVLGVINSL